MDFKHPVAVYSASNNLDAHLVVQMLMANGVTARAVEDLTGINLWVLGTVGQSHRPKVWVDESDVPRATQLLHEFDEQRKLREAAAQSATTDIHVVCEDCGGATVFPGSFGGTTQLCPHCLGHVDVGNLPWDDDVGEPED